MPPLDVRRERVVVETDRYRVEGDVTLPPESYRNALLDYLNRSGQEFLYLENSELTALDGSGRDWHAPVLMLAKRFIHLVVPTDHSDKK